jgi:hypothetical protein
MSPITGLLPGRPAGIAPTPGYAGIVTTPPDEPVRYTEIRALPNQQFDVLAELAAPTSDEQPQYRGEREVNERKEHPPMLPELATARSRTGT